VAVEVVGNDSFESSLLLLLLLLLVVFSKLVSNLGLFTKRVTSREFGSFVFSSLEAELEGVVVVVDVEVLGLT